MKNIYHNKFARVWTTLMAGVVLLLLFSTTAVAQSITQIIDATGDGTGNTLDSPSRIAVDGSSNVYVVGAITNNVFKITPGGVITEIINATGDGAGNILFNVAGMAVDGSGNVYVAGNGTDNVFKITPGGTITEIIDNTGGWRWQSAQRAC